MRTYLVRHISGRKWELLCDGTRLHSGIFAAMLTHARLLAGHRHRITIERKP